MKKKKRGEVSMKKKNRARKVNCLGPLKRNKEKV